MKSEQSRLRRILHAWRLNYSGRRQLLALDDKALKDIGVSRAEAMEEGRKPFWKR